MATGASVATLFAMLIPVGGCITAVGAKGQCFWRRAWGHLLERTDPMNAKRNFTTMILFIIVLSCGFKQLLVVRPLASGQSISSKRKTNKKTNAYRLSLPQREKENAHAAANLAEGTALSDEASPESQQKAVAKFKLALSIYRKIKFIPGEAKALEGLGTAYDYLESYGEARRYFLQALWIRHQLKDKRSEASLLTSLSFVSYRLKQYARAREYSQRSLATYQRIKDQEGEKETRNNLDFISKRLTEANTKQRQGPASSSSGGRSGIGGGGSGPCVCRQLYCNANGCWWHYYYCYC